VVLPVHGYDGQLNPTSSSSNGTQVSALQEEGSCEGCLCHPILLQGASTAARSGNEQAGIVVSREAAAIS
jgi:hypothetical protein